MTVIIIIVLVLVLILIGIVVKHNEDSKIIKDEEDKLKLQGWYFTRRYMNLHRGFIIVDEAKKKVACFTFSNNNKRTLILNFEDILSCEILKDGETTYKKSSSRTIGGVLLGGALLGGVGAIVGGLGGTTKKNVKVTRLELKLVIRDLQTPNWIITFFDGELQFLLKNATENINQWKDIFSVIIDNVDKSEKGKEDIKEVAGNIYEQLHKIAELKDKGILTDEEFNTQKTKILA